MNLRSYRIFNLAIIDYVVTFFCVLILHSYMWYYADVANKSQRSYFLSLIHI